VQHSTCWLWWAKFYNVVCMILSLNCLLLMCINRIWSYFCLLTRSLKVGQPSASYPILSFSYITISSNHSSPSHLVCLWIWKPRFSSSYPRPPKHEVVKHKLSLTSHFPYHKSLLFIHMWSTSSSLQASCRVPARDSEYWSVFIAPRGINCLTDFHFHFVRRQCTSETWASETY